MEALQTAANTISDAVLGSSERPFTAPDRATKIRALIISGQDAENRAQIIALQAEGGISTSPLDEAKKSLDYQAAERILAGWNRQFDGKIDIAIATLIDRTAEPVMTPGWAARFRGEYEQFKRRSIWLADQVNQ